MKRYILGRLIRSIISIFIVTSIVISLVYLFIPRDNIFKTDATITKLSGNPDKRRNYMYSKYEDLGYIDYKTQAEICKDDSDISACTLPNSPRAKELANELEKNGYEIGFTQDGYIFASRDFTSFELIKNFYSNLLEFDYSSKVVDPNNPNLERGVYFGTDHNGLPALKCSGCEHKYLIYFNSQFPFIHQNFISFSLGLSFPTYQNIPVLEVISQGQGELDITPTLFETGKTMDSAANLHSLKYKLTEHLDTLDSNKFVDNYAKFDNYYTSPSMIGVSYLFGLLALIVAYLIAVPAGIIMARRKGKLADKIGIVYINLMIAVPSLAFIFFAKSLGQSIFGLPDKFPQYGFGDVRSYILPILILALLNTAGLMIWIRRYMIDQASSDYVKFAKAKGLSQKEIFRKHIFKNAIIPLVNGIPASVILAIGGAVITETIFAVPGMGKMFPDAIAQNNNAMIVALTFIFTSLSILATLLGDVLMIFVDPRIQLNVKGDAR